MIVAPLGAGGMGEVYRARDSKLGRDVAIKILPSHFTADPERRARFAREARLLATLNHPHIGAIYGLEETDGLTALILELVEGPTLADRLALRPLPIADALAIARQIADALEAAHEKGIVHRDLKPANIVLQGGSGSGEVRAKVLDFGLAKTTVERMDGASTLGMSSPSDGTADGRILGTPAYMSPEQARGLAVDKRTDIWAFGCVLYEVLSGRRAFDGATVSDTFVSVLEREPDWAALPAATPGSIRTLLERCLRKDARKRLHDIADALIEIDDCEKDHSGSRNTSRDFSHVVHSRTRERVAWLAAGLLGLAFITTVVMMRSAPDRHVEPTQFTISPAENTEFQQQPQFAVSPDARFFVLVAVSRGVSSLWLRPKSSPISTPLPGTEGAVHPFWSPDGVLFTRGRSLMAQPFDPVTRRSKAETAITLADDVTFFSVSASGVLAHAAAAGTQLTWLDRAGRTLGTFGDTAFMVALSPDGTRVATSSMTGDVVLFDLARPTNPRRLTSERANDFFPIWSPTGEQVAFAPTRNGRYQILRRPADFSSGEELLLDESAPIIAPTDWARVGNYIAYTKAGPTTLPGIWVLPMSGSRTPFRFRESRASEGNAHFSPDGHWMAYTSEEAGKGREVFVAPFPGPGAVHLVSDGGGMQPMWSKDGKELFYFRPDSTLMSAAVETERTFKPGMPRKLFSVPVNLTVGWGNEYAVSKDGNRILVNVLSKPKPITVVLDWLALTKRKNAS